MIKSKDIFLSPSGDFGIGLVQDNLTNPNPHLGMSVEIFFNLNLTKGSLLSLLFAQKSLVLPEF